MQRLCRRQRLLQRLCRSLILSASFKKRSFAEPQTDQLPVLNLLKAHQLDKPIKKHAAREAVFSSHGFCLDGGFMAAEQWPAKYFLRTVQIWYKFDLRLKI
jgi:hypothetical protein